MTWVCGLTPTAHGRRQIRAAYAGRVGLDHLVRSDDVEEIALDPDCLADLASDAGSARAGWFDEFTAEAHIIVSGIWPSGHDPDGPEDLFGEHVDLGDPAAGRT